MSSSKSNRGLYARRIRSRATVAFAGGLLAAATLWTPQALAKAPEKAPAQPAASAQDELGLDALSNALTRVARTAKPSVVSVQTRTGRQKSAGSGVVFDARGHVVTSFHVIDGASQVEVVLADGRKFTAQVVGTDPKTDVAVLRIQATHLTPGRFADSARVEVGNLVLAIGSPFMLSQTVSHGIVSATGRSDVDVTGMVYQNFIQTDAPTNPGNSGGALVNTHGEVIGINTAIATESGQFSGVAFATPSNTVTWVAKRIISGQPLARGYLGVSIGALASEVAQRLGLIGAEGVLIEQVTPNSPAERAGLRPDDVILQIDGIKVSDRGQFQTLVAELGPGGRTVMTIWRDGRQRTLEVVAGQQPKS